MQMNSESKGYMMKRGKMIKNEIEQYEKKYDKNGIQIISRKANTIEDLIRDIDGWHGELARIILAPNNLYYYATSNPDSDCFLEELTEDNLCDVKAVLENLINAPEEFQGFYREKCDYAKRVEDADTVKELDKIILESGIKINRKDYSDINKLKERIHSKLRTDFCFGVFGEILFYNVVENILYNKLLLSKVQFITAPYTNAHGSDGVFCDEKEKILFFGESKFTFDLKQGINQAIASMNECLNRIKNDKNIMLTHRNDLKNGYGTKIDRSNIKEYTCKILIFLLHGTEVDELDIVTKIEELKGKLKKKVAEINCVVVSFPIYSKEHLKESIAKGVSDYDK